MGFPTAKELPTNQSCLKATVCSQQIQKEKEKSEFVSRGGLFWAVVMTTIEAGIIFSSWKQDTKQLQSYQFSRSPLHHCGRSSQARHHISTTTGRSVQFRSGTGQPCTWTWLQATHKHKLYSFIFRLGDLRYSEWLPCFFSIMSMNSDTRLKVTNGHINKE